MRGAVGLRVMAALAALGSLGAGVQVVDRLDPGQNARAESRGPNSPGSLVPAQQQSPMRRLLDGNGFWGTSVGRVNYIRRPFGSVARDKRAARKRRNVVRARRAGR